MNLSILSSRNLILYVLLTLLVINIRGMEQGDCGEEYDGGQSATSDRSAGLGMELESAYIQFESTTAKNDPNPKIASQSKGKTVNGLRGTNWRLTADVLPRPGALDAEIVLDGRSIKPGTRDLGRAAHDAILRLQDWNPSVQSPNRRVTIDSSPFNDWTIADPPYRNGVNQVTWAPQVTVPMPLEGIQWLIGQGNDPRISMYSPGVNTVKVLPDFFKTSPAGITPNDVKNRPDVLGFLSIVLTYAKSAHLVPSNLSPKHSSKIMPRTDFTTIFQTQGISQVIPRAHLYDIVKALACFKSPASGNYLLDPDFCTGSFDSPMPNDKMDNQKWQSGNQGQQLTIRDWLQSIADGTVPDGLTTFDENFSSSIGGFGNDLENVLNTNRAVPLFEFRGLPERQTWELVKFANAVEDDVVDLHRQFSTAPRRRKKRTSNMRSPIQRRDSTTIVDNACPVGCFLCDVNDGPLSVSAFASMTASPSSAPTTTSSASSSSALADSLSDSSSSVLPPTPSSTDAPGSSPIVSTAPTCTVWLSNKSISIGNANEQDNGKPLRQKSFDAIKKHCPPSPATCDSDLASVDDIWTYVGGSMQEISVQFETQISSYSDDKTFNTMLDAGLSTWQQFSTKSCKKVPQMNGKEQNCDESDPLKRDLAIGPSVEERAIGDGEIHYPCKQGGTICNAPDHISVLFEGPDGDLNNHLEIDVSIKLDGDDGISKFVCKELIEGIGALAMAVFPELAEVDLIGEMELESLCK